jgi:hypothetical protein
MRHGAVHRGFGIPEISERFRDPDHERRPPSSSAGYEVSALREKPVIAAWALCPRSCPYGERLANQVYARHNATRKSPATQLSQITVTTSHACCNAPFILCVFYRPDAVKKSPLILIMGWRDLDLSVRTAGPLGLPRGGSYHDVGTILPGSTKR